MTQGVGEIQVCRKNMKKFFPVVAASPINSMHQGDGRLVISNAKRLVSELSLTTRENEREAEGNKKDKCCILTGDLQAVVLKMSHKWHKCKKAGKLQHDSQHHTLLIHDT